MPRCAAPGFAVIALLHIGVAAQAQNGPPSCPAVLHAKDFVVAWTAAVIGPGNRDHACLRQLLTPDAKLTGAVPDKDGKQTLVVESPEEFIAWYERRGAESFWERTIHSTADVYENVARVTRTYEVRSSPAAPVQARGIEDFQLIFDGNSWRAFSLLWQDEVKGKPLPSGYLK